MSLKLSLLPDQYLPQSQECFCTASLVRWIILFRRFFVVNSLQAVRMQPSSYQQQRRLPLTVVTSMQQRMSNLRLLQRQGIRQRCTMCDRSLPLGRMLLFFMISRIQSTVYTTSIPHPLLEFSPGFTIHRLFFQQTLRKLHHYWSPSFWMWQVQGMYSKGFLPTARQQDLRLQQSAFLLLRFQLNQRWLWILSLLESRDQSLQGQGRRMFMEDLQSSYRQDLESTFWKPKPVCSRILSERELSQLPKSYILMRGWPVQSMPQSRVPSLRASRYLLLRDWVQQRCASDQSWQMVHQDLFLIMFLTRTLLFPLPTKALQYCPPSFSLEMPSISPNSVHHSEQVGDCFGFQSLKDVTDFLFSVLRGLSGSLGMMESLFCGLIAFSLTEMLTDLLEAEVSLLWGQLMVLTLSLSLTFSDTHFSSLFQTSLSFFSWLRVRLISLFEDMRVELRKTGLTDTILRKLQLLSRVSFSLLARPTYFLRQGLACSLFSSSVFPFSGVAFSLHSPFSQGTSKCFLPIWGNLKGKVVSSSASL